MDAMSVVRFKNGLTRVLVRAIANNEMTQVNLLENVIRYFDDNNQPAGTVTFAEFADNDVEEARVQAVSRDAKIIHYKFQDLKRSVSRKQIKDGNPVAQRGQMFLGARTTDGEDTPQHLLLDISTEVAIRSTSIKNCAIASLLNAISMENDGLALELRDLITSKIRTGAPTISLLSTQRCLKTKTSSRIRFSKTSFFGTAYLRTCEIIIRKRNTNRASNG